jgi:hypothetical protein
VTSDRAASSRTASRGSGGTEGPTRGQTKKAHVGRNCTVSAADVGAWDGAIAVQQVLFPGHSLARARVGVFRARRGPTQEATAAPLPWRRLRRDGLKPDVDAAAAWGHRKIHGTPFQSASRALRTGPGPGQNCHRGLRPGGLQAGSCCTLCYRRAHIALIFLRAHTVHRPRAGSCRHSPKSPRVLY